MIIKQTLASCGQFVSLKFKKEINSSVVAVGRRDHQWRQPVFSWNVDMRAYRIYSRISREILDKNKAYFYQFDLYAGQQIEKLINLRIYSNRMSMYYKGGIRPEKILIKKSL